MSTSQMKRSVLSRTEIERSTGRSGGRMWQRDSGRQVIDALLVMLGSVADLMAVREDYSADGDAWSRESFPLYR
jgi:hypothetical protein